MSISNVTNGWPHFGAKIFRSFLKRAASLSHLTQLHAQIICHGLKFDAVIVTKLIQRIFDFSCPAYASSIFCAFSKPDIFLFNVLFKGFSDNNLPLFAIHLFTYLRNGFMPNPDKFSYAFTISAAASVGNGRIGLPLHGKAVVDGFSSDLFVGCAIVDFYFKAGRGDVAQKTFDRMPERDTVLYNTAISGWVSNSCYRTAIILFTDMVSTSAVPFDLTTLIVVLPAMAELRELRSGMGLHAAVMKSGFSSHISIVTSLISLYSKCMDINTASILFRSINKKDLISCNAMIYGFTCNGDSESSLQLFRELLISSEKLNCSTILGLIPLHHHHHHHNAFSHSSLTLSIHGFSIKYGFVLHCSVSTALITVYSRLNEMGLAQKLFDESSEKSLGSWNTMISGYTQNGLPGRAISLFRDMQIANIIPNPITFTSALSACAQLGASSVGKWVHGLVDNKSFGPNIFVSTALIDMYAKCGSIEEARKLFDLMPEKNEVTWNAMIAGYGLHGNGEEALKLFHEMQSSCAQPTAVTFLSALHACSHAGLVEEGNQIFHSMIHDHGFEPSAEHYACMVDIFGRAGQLKLAVEFIEHMPVNPGPAVWASLLAACRVQKDTNLASLACERLLNSNPETMGYYVLLSNIYSSRKDYEQAAFLWQAAKNRNLTKAPGFTMIEVGQSLHVFTAGDRSHPQSAAIYSEMEKLMAKMKEAGFQTETLSALHDVEEEEKELLTKVHSERLAIAFGLISTHPGSEIRIFKNLRICLDCHTATKVISLITKRVIIARDANRFHHFKGGMCSCGDYW